MLLRPVLLASSMALIGLAVRPCDADWTDDVFPVKSHNFGTVAVAAKTEFKFPIRNTFSTQMHIRSVRASCGCTTPFVETQYINPGETGTIRARFNTDTFRGQRGATLTVVLDRPFYTEVRLRVDGYIRSDMVFHPGAVEFGQLGQGEGVTQSTKVLYAGRSDWQIVDVESNRPWLIPTLTEVDRTGGRVTYQIDVALREDAPEGFFQDELIVKTNDRGMPRVPLRVTGQVESPLSISPRAIALGSLKPGQTVTQKLILLGREPFAIASIKAEGWNVDFKPSEEVKKTHIVFPKFTFASATVGPHKNTIEITTAGGQSVTAKALLTADIRDQ